MAVVNPDTKQEVVGGLVNSLLSGAGVIILIIAVGITTVSKLFGFLGWAVGAALLGFSLYLSIRQKHGSGLRVANIIIKAVILGLLTLLEVLALIA